MAYTTVDPRYTRTASYLHWLIAIVIIVQAGLGLIAHDLPRGDALRSSLFPVHFSLGVLIFFLASLRLAWRLTHRPPPHPGGMRRWEIWLARLNYIFLYMLMFGLPISGYGTIATRGRPVSFFGLFDIPPLFPVDKALHERFENAHEAMFKILLALLILHILGALKHQFLDRSRIFRRISPF